MRYLLKFSYDGSKYYGYQCQPGLNTIQECLEGAICKVNNNIKRSVHSSGRTDKGVHALCQYAHVDLDIDITPKKLKRAINSHLPDDIHIVDTCIVNDDFHARYHVVSKKYEYYLNLGEYNPIEKNYVFQYNYELNIDIMNDAIKVFLGEHDFRAFVTEGKEKENCVRTITSAYIEKIDNEKIKFVFEGTGFLRYQIRNMVGILIKVGENKISTEDVEKILLSKDRSKSGKTAPANGLYLVDVKYNSINLEKKSIDF